MMMPVHAFKLWCKCLITEMEMRMSSDGYVMMQMFLVGMSWYKCTLSACHDANVRLVICNDASVIFMMQMSHAGVEMQSLFMIMPVHAFKLWCKCLLTEMEMRMSSDGYVMMQMLLVGMSWCKCTLGACHNANVRLVMCNDVNVPLWVCHDENVRLGVCYDMNAPL